VALVNALQVMKQEEYWSLRNQSKHAGKNPSTDVQIAISEVALPALEAAVQSISEDDYNGVLDHLNLAVTTDGTKRKKNIKKDLVNARG